MAFIAPLADRVKGCLLGGALGDAWGGEREGYTGDKPFEIPAHARLSDDTQLTLATCESIIEQRRVDPANIASHMLRWYLSRKVRGLGSSTLKALRDLEGGTHWALAGATGEHSAGNGAAMRVAPLAFLLDPARAEDRQVIEDVCRITHRNDEAFAGALAVVAALRAILAGEWNNNHSFLASAIPLLPDTKVRDRMELLTRFSLPPSEIAHRFGASGYVVESVPFALYCAQFVTVQPIEQVLQQAIQAGGDTDTVASIAGQLAGTAVGASNISQSFISGIQNHGELTTIVDEFAATVSEITS